MQSIIERNVFLVSCVILSSKGTICKMHKKCINSDVHCGRYSKKVIYSTNDCTVKLQKLEMKKQHSESKLICAKIVDIT